MCERDFFVLFLFRETLFYHCTIDNNILLNTRETVGPHRTNLMGEGISLDGCCCVYNLLLIIAEENRHSLALAQRNRMSLCTYCPTACFIRRGCAYHECVWLFSRSAEIPPFKIGKGLLRFERSGGRFR